MFNLKELLLKEVKDITTDEKSFMTSHCDEMTEEEIKKFGIEEKDFDENALGKLINLKVEQGIQEAISKMVDAKRGKILNEKTEENSKWSKNTKEWCLALVNQDTEKMKAMTTSSSDTAKAGYTIPTELYQEVIRLIADEYGVARKEMFYLPFTGAGNSRDISTLASSVSLAWTDEAVKKTSTQPVFAKVTQTLKKLACIIPMTEELLEDSAIDLPGLISNLVAEKIAQEEDEQFFNGTGAPWTGICNNDSVTAVTMAAASGFEDITADNLLDMQDAALSGSYNGSKYYLHRTILSYVRKLKAATGEYIFQAPGAGLPGTIWGQLYVLVEGMPKKTDNAANKGFVIYGNLKKYAIIGDKGSLRVKILTEGTITDTDGQTAINLAEQDMIAWRFVERVGYILPIPTAIVKLKTNTTIS